MPPVKKQAREQLTHIDVKACASCDDTISPKVMAGNKTSGVRSAVFGMSRSLRCRVDYMNMSSADAIKAVRVLHPRHWFLRPLLELRYDFLNESPELVSPQAKEWNSPDGNRFRQKFNLSTLTKDFFWEMLVSSNVIAIWKKRKAGEPLPQIQILNAEECDIVLDQGYLAVKIPSKYVVDAAKEMTSGEKAAYPFGVSALKGERMITKRPLLESSDSADYAEEYDFEIWQNAKTSLGLLYPSSAVILDDLDLLEMFRMGDWTGAWKRKEVIRHHKLGYAVTSGNQAGTKTGQATPRRIKKTNETMAQVHGAGDVATNFDHEIAWVNFPEQFFKHDAYDEVNRRLIFHGGYCALMLMSSKGQIEANGGYLLHVLRNEVLSTRKQVGDEFINRILNSPSWLGEEVGNTPELEVKWGELGVYSTTELMERITKLGINGYASPQTVREWAGMNDERESDNMRKAHENRVDYAPPYERAQGLLPQLFPEEFPDGEAVPAGAAKAVTSPDGGRPS